MKPEPRPMDETPGTQPEIRGGGAPEDYIPEEFLPWDDENLTGEFWGEDL